MIVVGQGGTARIVLRATDADEGDDLRFSIASLPSRGTLTHNSTGAFVNTSDVIPNAAKDGILQSAHMMYTAPSDAPLPNDGTSVVPQMNAHPAA